MRDSDGESRQSRQLALVDMSVIQLDSVIEWIFKERKDQQ